MSHSDRAIYEDAAEEVGAGQGSRELQKPDTPAPQSLQWQAPGLENRAPELPPHWTRRQEGMLDYQNSSKGG